MSAPVLVNALSRRPRGLHVPSRDSSSSPEAADADSLGVAHARAHSAGAVTRRTILRRDAHSQPASAAALRITEATAGGIAVVSDAAESDAGGAAAPPARSASAGPLKRVTWASERRAPLPSEPAAEAATAAASKRSLSPLEATAAALAPAAAGAAPAAAGAAPAAAGAAAVSSDSSTGALGPSARPADAERVVSAAAASSDSRAARLARHGPFLQMQSSPAHPAVLRPNIATVSRPLARKKKPGGNKVAPLTATAAAAVAVSASASAPAPPIDPDEADRAISAAVSTAASLVVGFFGGMLSAITEAVDDDGTDTGHGGASTTGSRFRSHSNKIAPIPLPAAAATTSPNAGTASTAEEAATHAPATGHAHPDASAVADTVAGSGAAPVVGLGKDAPAGEHAIAEAADVDDVPDRPPTVDSAAPIILAASKDDAVSAHAADGALPQTAAAPAATSSVDAASGWVTWLAGAGGALAAAGNAAASAVVRAFASDPTHSGVVAPMLAPGAANHSLPAASVEDIHRDFTAEAQYATDEDSEPDDFERTSSRDAAREVAAMRAATFASNSRGGVVTVTPATADDAAAGAVAARAEQPVQSRPPSKRSAAPTTLCEMCAMGEDGTAILMHACMNDHLKCMTSLLAPLAAKRRAEVVDGRDRLGRTAYHIAAAFDRPDAVAVLAAVSTARVNSLDDSLHTPLHYAAQYGHAAAAGALVRKASADISIADGRGNNALHLCASTGEHAVMGAVLGGADVAAAVGARNQLGHTPLHLCSNPLCVMLLMRNSAPHLSPDLQGLHPLHGIASRADDATVGAFIDGCLAAGADIQDVIDLPAANGSGLTPLMVAAYNGNSSTADGLLAHGAAATVTDAAGRTPAALAVLNNHDALGGKLLRWEISQRQHSPAATSRISVTAARDAGRAGAPPSAPSTLPQAEAPAVEASAPGSSSVDALLPPDAAPRAPPAGRRRTAPAAVGADTLDADDTAAVAVSSSESLAAGALSRVSDDGRPIVAIVDVDSSRLPSDDELSDGSDADADGSDAAGGSAYGRKKVKDAPLRRHGRRRENYLAMVQAHKAEQPYKDAAHGRVEPPKCVLCHDVRVSRAFLPCEHACACDPCIARLELGPPIARMRHMSAAGKEVSRITTADVIKSATGGAGTSAAVVAESGGAAPAGAAMYWDMCPVCVAQIVSIVPIGEVNGDHAKKVMAAAIPLMVGGSVQPLSTDFTRLFAVSGKKLRKWVHTRQTTGKWAGPPTRSLSGIVDDEMRAEAAAAGSGTFCL